MGWQYVFPASSRYQNPDTGEQGRHHIHETAIQKSVKTAIKKAEYQNMRAVIRFVIPLQPT
jgi:hypothetical protein